MKLRFISLVLLTCWTCLAQLANAIEVDIPDDTPLSTALELVAQAADVQLLYVPAQVANHRVKAIKGEFTLDSALSQVLSGSLLRFLSRGNVVVVKPRSRRLPATKDTSVNNSSTRRSQAVEVVLVSARKRIEFAQDVPITLNVLDGARLNSMDIQSPDNIENHYVNLTTNTRSAVSTGFAIRGVGTNNIHVSAQQSVGTNIDDIAAVSPFVSVTGLFDLDRIEILRGPQNTLYGRNTIGGVINYHTKTADPHGDLGGGVKLRAGNGGLKEFEGAIGFPITDKIGARLAVMDRSFDGLWTNLVDGQDYGAKASQAARLNIVWDAGRATSVALTLATADGNGDNSIRRQVGDLSRDGVSTCPAFEQGDTAWIAGVNDCWSRISSAMISDNDYLSAQLTQGNTNLLLANPNYIGNGGTDTQYDYLVNYSSKWGETYQHESGGYTTSYDNLRLKLEHDFEGAQITSLSAFNTFDLKSVNSNDLSGFEVINDGEWDVFQQELRLSSIGASGFSWLAGLYYNYSDSKEDTWVIRSEIASSPAMIIDSEYEAWSVYGELDYALSDVWSVIVGGRYTDDILQGYAQKTVCTQEHGVTFGLDGGGGYDRDYRADTGCTRLPLGDSRPTQKLSETGWKLGLNWQADTRALVYGSVSKGFKGGAYDNRALARGEQPIDPEFLLAYELGVKSEWFDSALQLNGAIYKYDWQDIQVFATAPDSSPHLFNIPRTELKGLELEAKWSPTDLLYMQLGLAFSDNKIVELTEFQRELTQWEPGFEIANAPDFTANLLIEKRIPIGAGELVLQGSYRYMSDYFYFTASPDMRRAKSSDHRWLSGRVSYNFGKKLNHSVVLWGDNLAGERSIAALNSSLPGNINYPGQVEGVGFATWGFALESQF